MHEWTCAPAGVRSFKLTSSIRLGDDGEFLCLYVGYPSDNTIFITDAGQATRHLIDRGIRFDSSRIRFLNETFGVQHASINESGEIEATTSIADQSDGFWDVVKVCMNATFMQAKWEPKFNEHRFQKTVKAALEARKNYFDLAFNRHVEGASGHQIEFPFVVVSKGKSHLISTISLNDQKYDWQTVYQTNGRLADVKRAQIGYERFVILEEGPASQMAQVETALSDVSHVATIDRALDRLCSA